MALGAAADRDRTWEQLPPLEGANRLGEPKPAAQVLAETPDGKPLLVVQDAGGRVMAFAGDTTWHWWMEGFEAPAQAILASGRAVAGAQGRDSRRQRVDQAGAAPFRPAATGRVHRRRALAAGRSRSERAKFEAEVTLPDGKKQKLNLVAAGRPCDRGISTTRTRPATTRSRSRPASGGAPVGSARSRFLVFEQDLELDNAVADPTLLASLAAMTKDVGGQSLRPRSCPTCCASIAEQSAGDGSRVAGQADPVGHLALLPAVRGADQHGVVSAEEVGAGVAGATRQSQTLRDAINLLAEPKLRLRLIWFGQPEGCQAAVLVRGCARRDVAVLQHALEIGGRLRGIQEKRVVRLGDRDAVDRFGRELDGAAGDAGPL